MAFVRQTVRDFVVGATVGVVNAELRKLGSDLTWLDRNSDHRWDVDKETYREGRLAKVDDRSLDIIHKAAQMALIGDGLGYQIITDRYIDGNPANNHFSPSPPANFTGSPVDYWSQQDNDPSGESLSRILGGDLDGIITALPHLREMGVDTIWISPVMDNPSGVLINDNEVSTQYHYYWQISTTHMDEHLTTSGKREPISSLAVFTAACKKAGIKVMVDINFDHIAPQGLNGGERLFAGDELLMDCSTDPLCTYSDSVMDWEEPAEGELTTKTFMSLGKILLYKRDEVGLPSDQRDRISRIWQALQDMAKSFVEDAHVDGFRIDVLKHIYRPFIEEFVTNVRKMKPDILIVGEYFSYGYYDAGLDSAGHDLTRSLQLPVFDFQLQALAASAFTTLGYDYGVLYPDYGDKRISDVRKPHTVGLAEYLGRMFDEKYYEEAQRNYLFSSNHDKPRFLDRQFWPGSPLPPDQALEEEYKLLSCLPGKIMVYYGDEMYLRYWSNRKQTPEERQKLGSFWGPFGDPYNRVPMPIAPVSSGEGATVWQRQRWASEEVAVAYAAKAVKGSRFMRTMSDFRRRNPAIALGSVRGLDPMTDDPTHLEFVRVFGDNEVLYWHRRGDRAGEADTFDLRWPAGTYTDVFTGKKYTVDSGGRLIIPADSSFTNNSFRTVVLELNPKTE